MPSKNTIRSYISNNYYHVYNRGVEKRNIFIEQSDYKMFLYYMFIYLAPPLVVEKTYPDLKNALKKGNLNSTLEIHSYVFMPNHFHFILYQKKEDCITQFMRRITNAYTRYFNEKYDRVGSLFQGVFKSILIDKDEYLLYLNRYIHRNPITLSKKNKNLHDYIWSSYRTYLGIQNSSYIKKDYFLEFFSNKYKSHTYKSFVESEDEYQLPEEYIIDKY